MTTRTTPSAAIAVLALSLPAGSVASPQFSSPVSSLASTFVPIHDARVESANPTVNYGSITPLRIRGGTIINSYLKFTIAGVPGPIDSARVRLYCDDGSLDGGRIQAVSNNYLGTSTPWIESGLTWDNAPAISGPILDQNGEVFAGTWVEFDVAAAITGNGTYSFALTSNSTNIAGFHSKEGANPPQLILIGVPPIVGGFSPASGVSGTEVTVTGTGFLGAGAVTFNGMAASFVVDSDTQIRATVPSGAKSGPIRITDVWGAGISSTDFVLMPPQPELPFAPVHDARVEAANPGVNYGSDAQLQLRGGASPIHSLLKFNVAGLVSSVASARIRLFCVDGSGDGGKIHVSANNYSTGPQPWVESFLNWNNAPSPTGPVLAVAGAVTPDAWIEFDVTAVVAGNGIHSFRLVSNLTDIAGYSSKEGPRPPQLVIQQRAPTISGFSPPAGTVGQQFTVTGSDLSAVTEVTFNSLPAAFTIDNDTQLRAAMPPGTSLGLIRVTSPTGSASSANSFGIMPGLWTTAAELAAKPTSGVVWELVLIAADSAEHDTATITDQNSNHNIATLAAGIVFARTGITHYRDIVARACDSLVAGGKPTGRSLPWARELGAYVLAADLVGHRTSAFEFWLRNMAEIWEGDDDRHLLEAFWERPNNWGANAFSTIAAIYGYLGDSSRLVEIRDYWIQAVVGPNPGQFYDDDLTWHADSTHPLLINPPGAKLNGFNVDGLIPDDMQRGGPFQVPPEVTNYPWEHMQGLVMAARILERRGLPIWNAGDDAIYRAAYAMQVRLESQYGGWKAEADDLWMLPFLDAAYGTNWSEAVLDHRKWQAGKNCGWAYVVWDAVPLAVDEKPAAIEHTLELRPVFPSPIRESGVVEFRLARAEAVDLRVLDVTGRVVRVLARGTFAPGTHRVEFAAGGLASGMYVVWLAAGGAASSAKVAIIR